MGAVSRRKTKKGLAGKIKLLQRQITKLEKLDTERKEAEEALRKSEERFRQVAESAGEWIWEVDSNGLYTYASPVVKKILGYKPKEIVGKKHFYDLFAPDVRAELKKAAFGVFAQKAPFRKFVNPNRHKNGDIVFLETSGMPILDENGNLLGYRGADTDVTERKEAEEALRRSEERFRLAFKNAKDAILWADPSTGLIIECNKAAEALLERKRKEIVGQFQTAIHPPQRADYYAKMFKKHIRQKGAVDDEAEVITKSGKIKPVHITASVALIGTKSVIQGIFRDITERKQIEQAKDNLVRDVSHELKTPISMAEMAYDMCGRGIKARDMKRIKKAHRIGYGNLKRLRKDVDNILELFALGRTRAVKTEVLSLRKIINHIMQDVKYLIEDKKLKVKIDIPKGADKILAPERIIRSLLYNLIDNAIKFTKHGSISLASKAKGKRIYIKVKDTGCGIPSKDMDKIFDEFYQRHAATPGTGLGLSICKEIIEMCKGEIKVASKGIGKGTTAVVSLPKG